MNGFCPHHPVEVYRPRHPGQPYCGITCGQAAKNEGWTDGIPPSPEDVVKNAAMSGMIGSGGHMSQEQA